MLISPLKDWLRSTRPWLAGLVAAVTLGSGLTNLFSVMGDPLLPERRRILREFFPMDFLRLSRSFTVLLGLALVVSSINIYRRKRRAWLVVLLLAGFSVLFHLTKGLDYEEATFSLLLVVVLVPLRKHFTVKSGTPELKGSLIRLAAAAGAALVYGVAGFWLLDQRQFGINFVIGDSVRKAILFLTMVGDASLVPHTRYAAWFLDSLYMTGFTVAAYSAFALFRPAFYTLSIHPHEIQAATEITRLHGRSALDFFKLWPDKSYLFSPSRHSFIAYGVAGSFALALADPVGPEEEIEPSVRGFLEMCKENGWMCGFHQTLPDFLPMYRRLGFHKLKIGDDAIVDLAEFSLDGKRMKQFRTEIRKLEAKGIVSREYEPPLTDEVLAQIREVSDKWLQIPGRRERRFTLGSFDPHYLRSTPVVAALDANGRMLGFVNLPASYRKGEATGDLMRRRIEAPNGIMDYLLVKILLRAKQQGLERFNLGMAPMSGFHEKEEATPEERAVHFFFQRLNFLFSYRGLRYYKAKFATIWEPRYAIYRNAFELPRMALALSKLSAYEE
jgi:phosphatidylglycerol lysyltransferase